MKLEEISLVYTHFSNRKIEGKKKLSWNESEWEVMLFIFIKDKKLVLGTNNLVEMKCV